MKEYKTLRTVILKALDLGYFILDNTSDMREILDILQKQFQLMEQLQQLEKNTEEALGGELANQ